MARSTSVPRWFASISRRQMAFAAVAVVPSAADLGLFAVLRQSAELPVVVANALSLTVASVISYGLHRLAAERSNPYARWTEDPLAFAMVALVAGAVDIVVLRLIFASTGFTATAAVLLAKLVSMSAGALVRIAGYRIILADVIRENRVRASRPLEAKPFRFSVVVPAFREPDTIGHTVQRIRDELADVHENGRLEVIVVDDGSGDDTAQTAELAGADQVLVLDRNRGKGAAVRAGVLAARGSTVAFTDADLAYSPDHLRVLLESIESGWDVVIGNRQHQASSVERQSTLRRLGSRAVNGLSALVLLDAPHDTQCGLKAFRSDVGREIFSGTRIDGFAFDIEVLHLVERAGWSLHDIPVTLDEAGHPSTVRVLRDTVGLVLDMLRIRQWSSGGAYDRVRPSPSARAKGS